MRTLAICIPNYNRIDKLKGLLEEITKQIVRDALEQEVEICISDDYSLEDPSRMIADMEKMYPGILFRYTRNVENRGMDYNFLNCVLLAGSMYCWIIGNDDMPTSYGIQSVLKQLQKNQEKVDIMVTPFDIYTDAEEVRGTIEPLKVVRGQYVQFDTSKGDEYHNLLLSVQHNSGLFGFLSNTVFKRKKWIEYERKFQDKLNTIFIQMYMNIQTLEDGADYLYCPEKIIKNYADDATNESVTRICKILVGLNGVMDYFFSGEVKQRLKKVIVDAYISGIVWELPEEDKYKQKIKEIDTAKNMLYKTYFVEAEKRKQFFEKEEVVIFGAGNYGKKVLQQLKKYDVMVVAVIDSDPLKQGSLFYGYTIQNPSIIYEIYKESRPIVVVANHFHLEEMVNTLLENKVDNIALIS